MIDLTRPTTQGIMHKTQLLSVYLDGLESTVNTLSDRLTKIVHVFVSDFPNLKAAIDSLPAQGGTVFVPEGEYECGDYDYNANYMSKANVSILGAKMPTYNDNLTALVGGSIIRGRFNVWADNFYISGVGFDMGRTYLEAKYPGADYTTASLRGGTWDAFAFASPNDGSPSRMNVVIKDVIGLLYNSNTLGHAVLCEGIRGGFIENVIAIYGVHGAVFKVMETNVHGARSYGQSMNGAIIKSDTYAVCGRSQFSGLIYMPAPVNTFPWATPAAVQNALNFDTGLAQFIGGIVVDGTYAYGAIHHVNFGGQFIGTDITINNVVTDGNGVTQWPVILTGQKNYLRIHIGSVTATNCQNGVFCTQETATTDPQLSIGNMQVTNIPGDVLVVSTNGCVTVGNLDAKNVGSLYNIIDVSSRVYVGHESVVGLTSTKFKTITPTLTNGWVNSGTGNSTFELVLSGYRANLKGLVANGSASVIAGLPQGLTPTATKRFCIATQSGYNSVEVALGLVKLGASTGAAGDWVSLDGVSWDY